MMAELLVLLAVAWPLSLATILTLRRSIWGATAWSWAVALAPVPALVAAIGVPDGVSVELSWLLLGSRWEIDAARRALLAAAALVWLLAGWQMRTRFANETHRTSLQLGWLLAFAGNAGVMLVHDVAGLYAFFALMSFSAYPLVVHTRTAEAMSAGRVYLAMTVLGEVLILSGLLIATRGLVSPQLSDLPRALAESSQAGLAIFCLWTGFGVKTAVAGLHLWLPGAYTYALPPVSAVLGGAMINAGVLGLLLTIPLGTVSLTTLGAVVLYVGLLGAFGAAIVGVSQRMSTTVLGYSSISQMGLLMIPLGAALHTPAIAPAAGAAITLFAVHHGLAKASLFLGVDIARRSNMVNRAVLLSLLLFVGASLSGAPLTSGAAAKLATKYALADIANIWPWLSSALSLAAMGTTLLVLRAVWCLAKETSNQETTEATSDSTATSAVPLAWFLSVALVLTGVWWLPLPDAARAWPGASAGDAVSLLWPIVLGVALAGAAAWASARHFLPRWHVPAGDLLVPVSALARVLQTVSLRVAHAAESLLRGSSPLNENESSPGTGNALVRALRNVRSRLRVEQPSESDAALRSFAPIAFAALIVATLFFLRG